MARSRHADERAECLLLRDTSEVPFQRGQGGCWHVCDMPTSTVNVCSLRRFGSPVSARSGPLLTQTGPRGPSPIFLVLPNTMSLCRSWIRRSLHELFDGRGSS